MEALFAQTVEKYIDPVRKALAKPVPQLFFDACCSPCFNIGPVGVAQSSAIRLSNAGNLPVAVDAILMWNKPAALRPPSPPKWVPRSTCAAATDRP